MIEHLVFMKFRPDAEPAAIDGFLDAFRALPREVPGIVEVTAGRSFSDWSQDYTHGLLLRFRDRDAFEAYKAHPALRRVLDRWDRIKAADPLEVDYEA